MTKPLTAFAIILYILAGITAFGHSAANTRTCLNRETRESDGECAAAAGMLASIFWPFYLSWVLFDGAEDA